MSTPFRLAALGIALGASPCLEARAQIARVETANIPSEVACAKCTIRLTSAITISSSKIASLTSNSVFAGGPNNEIAVGELSNPYGVVVLDSLGRVLRQLELKRRFRPTTSGPPDVLVFGHDGTLHVVDEAYDRFPPQSKSSDIHLSPFGSEPHQINDAVPVGPSVLVLQAMIPTRSGGKAFHVFDIRDGVGPSWGEASSNITYLKGFASSRRRLAGLGAGLFVAVAPNKYSLTVWDTAGGARNSWSVSSGWFKEWDAQESLPDIRRERWPSIIQDVSVDSSGLIWILGWVPRPDWQPQSVSASQGSPLTQRDLEAAFQSVVEIVDLPCGRVVVRARFDTVLKSFVGSSRAVSLAVETSEDLPRFRIFHLAADIEPYRTRTEGRCTARNTRK